MRTKAALVYLYRKRNLGRVIRKIKTEGYYYISRYDTEYEYVDELSTCFSRMYSSDGRQWLLIKSGHK